MAQTIQHVKVQRKRWYDDNSLKDNSAAPENAPAWAIASPRGEVSSSTSGGNTETIVDEEVGDEDVGSRKGKAVAIDRRESTAEEDIIGDGSGDTIVGGIGGRSGDTTEKDFVGGIGGGSGDTTEKEAGEQEGSGGLD